MCMCSSRSPPLYLPTYLPINQSTDLYGYSSICRSTGPYASLSIYLPKHPSIHSSRYRSIYLYAYLSIHLSILPFIRLSIDLDIRISIYQSIHPSILQPVNILLLFTRSSRRNNPSTRAPATTPVLRGLIQHLRTGRWVSAEVLDERPRPPPKHRAPSNARISHKLIQGVQRKDAARRGDVQSRPPGGTG